MSNVFGPKKPLFGPYTYRVKRNGNGDTLIAVYHGSKRIAHMDAYWAYSMRTIEEHEAEETQRAVGGRRRRLVCASDLRALGAEGKYPNVLGVAHAYIDDDAYKGKGIGRAMYEAMMVEGYAVRETRVGGSPGPMFFIPDECKGAGNTSAEAQRVWASLVRDYPSQGTSIRVDAPPIIGSRAKPNPRRRKPHSPQTDTPAFRRWFGDSKVVDAKGRPLVVYHGTAAKDFSAFSAGPRSHLGFHFGTQASAEDKLRGDVRRWEQGDPRRGEAPTYLTTEDMRVRARDVNRAALATIRAERSRIESGIRERSVSIDLGALLDAHGGDVEAALAEFHLLRKERDAKPTPEERRRLDDLDVAERRADDELAKLFAFRRPGERVLPVYLSIVNPLRMRDTNWGEPAMIKKDHPELRLRGRTLSEIRSEIAGRGYDGIVYENAVEDVGSLSWIAFHPEQIKSATGNRGTFDPADPDIRHNPRRRNSANTREGDENVPDCAWCGAACDQPHPYPNRRGEVFCSPSHRSAANRALARFLGAHDGHSPRRRRNPVTGAFSHDEGEQGTGEEIAGTLNDEPVGSIIVFPSAAALNQTLLREEFARFRDLPRGKVGWLGGIELPESSRNKGHGAAIVSAMLDEARALGVRSVVLHADSTASQRFWSRMGFVGRDTLPADVRRGLWMTPMVKML